jgi:hypothetical protein
MNKHGDDTHVPEDQNRDPEQVLFISGTVPEESPATTPGIKFHKRRGISIVTRTLEEVKEDWKVVVGQVVEMVAVTGERIGVAGFELDQVEISLGFSASGKLAFIAEAGVEASVTIAFKRRDEIVPG